jgi:CheY-like chemotaxis protein/DNA-binding XRE family transcriptional regulator
VNNPEEIRKSFGATARIWRDRLGISQEELAERAGLHRTYVSDIERGARNVSLESINKLASALEIPIATLFAEAQGAADLAASQPPTTEGIVDILLVEDNPDDVQLTFAALNAANMTNKVHVARDGVEALDFLFRTGEFVNRHRRNRPQVILLDLGLPKMDGLEVLRRIKADAHTQSIPVAVLTASKHDRDIVTAKRLGADAYIVKPVDFHSLSQIAPQLSLQWALMKSPSENSGA